MLPELMVWLPVASTGARTHSCTLEGASPLMSSSPFTMPNWPLMSMLTLVAFGGSTVACCVTNGEKDIPHSTPTEYDPAERLGRTKVGGAGVEQGPLLIVLPGDCARTE